MKFECLSLQINQTFFMKSVFLIKGSAMSHQDNGHTSTVTEDVVNGTFYLPVILKLLVYE